MSALAQHLQNFQNQLIALETQKFQLFLNQEQFTLRTNCENIKKFFENKILLNFPPKDG